MRTSASGQFPVASAAYSIGTASVQLTGVTRGVRYRIVSDQDCWITLFYTAQEQQDIFLPAKQIDYLTFGMDDPNGTDPIVNCIAAFPGTIYLTALRTVPTGG